MNEQNPPQEQGENRPPRQPNGQFRKGQSGHPGGRPRDRSLTATLRKLLSSATREEICTRVVELAKTGDLVAIRLLWDRVDGRPSQSLDITLGTSPRPNEGHEDFYRRLKSEAAGIVLRFFPGFDPSEAEVTRVIIEDREEFIGSN